MKKIAVLTGAGISAESGISTFRDSGGLWEGYSVMEVASMDGWRKNPSLVLNFYNERRKQLLHVVPNEAHHALKLLETKFEVTIITQNVDNLHERANSTNIIHLHGELTKSRSTGDDRLTYNCVGDIKIGDRCKKGFQLRPDIVWFGEQVPKMSIAATAVADADCLVIIGTSMVVYPAASLVDFVKDDRPIYVVNLEVTSPIASKNVTYITKRASEGVPLLVQQLLDL